MSPDGDRWDSEGGQPCFTYEAAVHLPDPYSGSTRFHMAKRRYDMILVPNAANNSPVRYRVPFSSDQRFRRM